MVVVMHFTHTHTKIPHIHKSTTQSYEKNNKKHQALVLTTLSPPTGLLQLFPLTYNFTSPVSPTTAPTYKTPQSASPHSPPTKSTAAPTTVVPALPEHVAAGFQRVPLLVSNCFVPLLQGLRCQVQVGGPLERAVGRDLCDEGGGMWRSVGVYVGERGVYVGACEKVRGVCGIVWCVCARNVSDKYHKHILVLYILVPLHTCTIHNT